MSFIRANTKKVVFKCSGESRTKASFAAECDINNIMRKYVKNGVLPEMIKANPAYGDYSGVEDFQSSLNTVIKAKEQFAALPSNVRKEFSNNPAQFLEYVANPANKEKMYELGMAIRPKIEEKVVVDTQPKV